MLQIVQAFDRAPIAEIPADDAVALEAKLEAATRVFRDRDGWPKPHERIAILRRLAALMEPRRDHFARADRARGRQAAQRRHRGGRTRDRWRAERRRRAAQFRGPRDPDGPDAGEHGRWAFTTKEPIGVVAAISAFNHPLNLIVHQVAPAIAVGCPVIVKPASATPLSLPRLRAARARSGPARAVVPDLHPGEQRARRAAGDRSTRRFPQLHRLGAGRLVSAPQAGARARARRWSMAARRPRSSTAAPISTASSSRWSRAATTMRARSACRPSASSFMPTLKPRSWIGSRRGFVRCGLAIRFA